MKRTILAILSLSVFVFTSCHLVDNFTKEDPPVLPEETAQQIRNKNIEGNFRTIVMGDDNTVFCRLDTLNFDDTSDFTFENDMKTSTDGFIEAGPYALDEDGVLRLTDKLDPAGNMNNKARIISLTSTDTASWAKQLMVGIQASTSTDVGTETLEGQYHVCRLTVNQGTVTSSEVIYNFNGLGNFTITDVDGGEVENNGLNSYTAYKTEKSDVLFTFHAGLWMGAVDSDGYFFTAVLTDSAENCGIMIGVKKEAQTDMEDIDGKFTVCGINFQNGVRTNRSLWQIVDEVALTSSTLSDSTDINEAETTLKYTLSSDGSLAVDGVGVGQFSKTAGVLVLAAGNREALNPGIYVGIKRY